MLLLLLNYLAERSEFDNLQLGDCVIACQGEYLSLLQ